jgi:DNA invertase Pin-like site-specific DNA recombinase
MPGIIGYCRVSTKKQGESGLGLDAQRAAVEAHAKQTGERILSPLYVEVESGKVSERPELLKALAHCRRSKATLCVAKMDRLSRNVAFLATLMESGVPFVACDNPHANRLTLHILAAVAEAEVKAISDRTKAALGAARRRGVKLGSAREGHWDGREDRRLVGAKRGAVQSAAVRAKKARDAYADLLPIIKPLRDSGATLQAIADRLNSEGHTTRQGKTWQPTQVMRLLGK